MLVNTMGVARIRIPPRKDPQDRQPALCRSPPRRPFAWRHVVYNKSTSSIRPFLHLLTAEDVSGLDLTDTELVVLSACETGFGAVRTGEGVFGLRRAFVLAGARALVMSLWKVPDRLTQELMVDFYTRLQAREPTATRASAFRDAQLAVKKRHPDPVCWGAFIYQGTP
jgi:CHAT domain-containing protein